MKTNKKNSAKKSDQLICDCKQPHFEKCVLTGILFCMKCLRPIQKIN